MTMTIDPLLRARRAVIESDTGWRVSDSEFETTDEALARAVADELDRVEPLDRTISLDEARGRVHELADDMEQLLDDQRPNRARMDELRRQVDVLVGHVERWRP